MFLFNINTKPKNILLRDQIREDMILYEKHKCDHIIICLQCSKVFDREGLPKIYCSKECGKKYRKNPNNRCILCKKYMKGIGNICYSCWHEKKVEKWGSYGNMYHLKFERKKDYIIDINWLFEKGAVVPED